MRKKRRKRKLIPLNWKTVLSIIFIIYFSILLAISTFSIIKWFIHGNKSNKQLEEINNTVIIENTIDNNQTEIIEQKEEIDKNNPYWKYIKMDMINVDFNELKEINDQTIGWIQVNGTNINYPFVKADDNEFYLNHSFNKSSNLGGWVFLDYRNNTALNNKNNIIYAHGMDNGTMFGSLKNILKNNWIKNEDNYIVKTSTDDNNSLWQVFSVYLIPTTNDYIKVNFNDNDFQEFINLITERSKFNFNTSVSTDDKILTLSTCYNNEKKVVLHAKLIKTEKKTS